MKKRSLFWDNYKGILICLVVFGHFIYSYATQRSGSFAKDLFEFIYLFHMPAFVFCSGYFSRSENACSKQGILKLILYYLVFNTLMMAFCYVGQGTQPQLLTPYNSYWYILALILWRISAPYLAKVKEIVPFAAVMALLIGFWGEFTNYLALGRTFGFLVFFLLGYKFDAQRFESMLQRRTKGKLLLGIAFGILVALFMCFVVRKYDVPVATLSMGAYTSGRQLLWRCLFMGVSAAAILAMLMTVPNIRIPVLTELGKHSLPIYLLHRFITLIFAWVFPAAGYQKMHLVYAAVATVITVLALGNPWFADWFAKASDWIVGKVTEHKSRVGKVIVAGMMIVAVLLSAAPAANIALRKLQTATAKNNPVNETELMDQSIKIAYVGDLVLLKDQIADAYDAETGRHSFDPMFAYVAPYLSEADLAIGVLEGPLAGEEKGYTTSNYGDGIKLYFNFPDAFAETVKNAGIDLVTTANNHLLDRDIDGAVRTLDVLDEFGLQHTGTYRNQQEKDTLLIVDVEGVKIAVLSYTWHINNYNRDQVTEDWPYLTSILPDESDRYYDRLLQEIQEDFAQAKASQADLILVMPHMGTQFSHETDDFQRKWNQIFADLGADIILGDHAHVVQPVEYVEDTLVVNCPGHVAEAYIGHNGDAAALVEIYIDRHTKEVSAAAVVPLYTLEETAGAFCAVPIYDALSQDALYQKLYARDVERIDDVHELITQVMLGEKIPITDIQKRYYYTQDGLQRNVVNPVGSDMP